MKIRHFMYVPFTGLGLYNGFRGNRWLRNRIKIFEQFVIPSLQAQTNKNFTLWISFRPEEKNNKYVKEFVESLKEYQVPLVVTFNGVCFYDDKYEEKEAYARLVMNLHGSLGEMMDAIGEVDYVYMTIQPSDDCYRNDAVELIQKEFLWSGIDAVGFKNGYITNYKTGDISAYNPETNPPFYTIKFKRDIFADPLKHIQYTSLKSDVGKYKKGTPLPSHEYVKDCLSYAQIDTRGFLVGTHSENISTYYDHPYKGREVSKSVLSEFGLENVELLKLRFSLRKKILSMLPHKVRRKVRYIFGERIWNKVYDFLRN